MITIEQINRFNSAIKLVSDYDFVDYSEKSFGRRIEKILADYKLTLDELINRVRTDKVFVEQIVRDITVNTTELFRDPVIWQSIKHRILPKLKSKSEINIWHAGCSTGQEVYSMLILLNEAGMLDKTNIYASDINTDVLNTAEEGTYVYKFNIEYLENFKQVIQTNPYNFEEVIDIPFSKYFEIDNIADTMTVKPLIKNKAKFIKHNLVKEDNTFGKDFDIILCRNVLIYFNSNLQNRLFKMFGENLKRKSYLILGAHETILGHESSKYIKHGKSYIKK